MQRFSSYIRCMKSIVALFGFLFSLAACAQQSIPLQEVTRIETVLASDSMQGRKAGTVFNNNAAAFIAAEFKKAGLTPLQGNSFLQPFQMLQANVVTADATINGNTFTSAQVIPVSMQPALHITDSSGYAVEQIKSGENIRSRVRSIRTMPGNKLVFIDTSFAKLFPQFVSFNQPLFADAVAEAQKQNTIYILGAAPAGAFTIDAQLRIDTMLLNNVVGVLPGKTRKSEQVLFSAHYDHLGIEEPQDGDSIYNGANDDASGTTAVIVLANHFKKLNNNARTLVFAAFTAEELGGFGSQYFSKQLAADSVVAMYNIEMIGTESKWGRNSAYITGFDKSSMGTILQKSLSGTAFKFYPDPYPEQDLFYRSDNATLARLGVPAHTLSTSKMDSEPNYHRASDEVKTLDLKNMTQIIKAIARSAASMISGKETPTRVQSDSLRSSK